MMKFGYVRVSTAQQAKSGYSVDDQKQKLLADGVDEKNIYIDVQSGKNTERAALKDMLSKLRSEDVVVITKLDRLSRSLRDLTAISEKFRSDGISLRSLADGVDTSTTAGRLFFNIMGSVAEFERETILERTEIGRDAARKLGKTGGRPKKQDEKLIARAKDLYSNPMYNANDAAKALGVSRAHFYKLKDM